jgi:hypothetical protein
MEQGANSCLISVAGADNAEAWVNNDVITSHSSLDLLVPDELLTQGYVVERGSLRTMPVLPDLECGTGHVWLQCSNGRPRGHP